MNGLLTRRRLLLLALAALLLTIAAQVDAQFRRGGGRGFGNARLATMADFDGGFQFCRVAFATDPRGDSDGNWAVDFPRADINLSTRLAELTKTNVTRTDDGEPNHLLIQLTNPTLFGCPLIVMSEVGGLSLTDLEAVRLREYLDKGGFLWADDFWGTDAWDWWVAQIRRALPADKYPIVDLPPNHPLFSAQFDVKQTPQIASIYFWSTNGGRTSERWEDSTTVHTRAILDQRGRVVVLITHNSDFGDAFEREAENPEYFMKYSVPGYAFGVNALLYAMTH